MEQISSDGSELACLEINNLNMLFWTYVISFKIVLGLMNHGSKYIYFIVDKQPELGRSSLPWPDFQKN